MTEKICNGCENMFAEMDCEDIFTPEDFTDEQRQISETTEQFVMNEVMPMLHDIETQDFDLLQKALLKGGELGLLMLDVPEEYGGLELDKATSMLVAEKVGPAGSFGVSYMAQTGIGTLPLVYYGSSEQKERYLDKLMTGEMMAAYCLTEPGSGSDALGARSTAILSEDGQHYILNGTKQFITNAGFADLFTVFAKIDAIHFTGFLIERSFAGVEIGPEEKKMGIKGSSTCQLIFNNVKVPVANLLGDVGQGHKIAFNVLNVGRFKLAALCGGILKYALSEGARYANMRKQFNVPIGSFGAIKEKLATTVAASFSCESMVYRLAGLLDRKIATIDKSRSDYYTQYQKAIEEYAAECAISKVFCSESVATVLDEVLQIHGGYGFISEYPIERMYRDERVQRIYEGTNEINRLLVAGAFLRNGFNRDLPLERAMEAASEFFVQRNSDPYEKSGLFAEEKSLLHRLKMLLLVLVKRGWKIHNNTLQDEQELLLVMADIIIQIFAIESVVMRSEKIYQGVSSAKKDDLKAVMKVCTFSANEKIIQAARRASFYLGEHEKLQDLLGGIQYFSGYHPQALLESRRYLAERALENEKYFF